MDDNTAKVLIAALGILGGLVTGVTVSALGYRFSRALERDRRAREDANRWLVDRRTLYARFLVAASDITDEIGERVSSETYRVSASFPPIDMHPLEIAFQELRLLAPPEVIGALGAHRGALRSAADLTVSGPDAPGDETPAGMRIDAIDLVAKGWRNTVAAIRADLGISPADPLASGPDQREAG